MEAPPDEFEEEPESDRRVNSTPRAPDGPGTAADPRSSAWAVASLPGPRTYREAPPPKVEERVDLEPVEELTIADEPLPVYEEPPAQEPTVEEPVLPGWDVFHAIAQDGTVYVAANNFVYGATVQRSTDGGKTWERSEGLGLPEDGELKLEKTWHVEPGRDSEPGVLWLGAAPGVLFRTEDSGQTWQLVESLLEDPTRERWQPGFGGMCTHSIQLDPADPKRMYVGTPRS